MRIFYAIAAVLLGSSAAPAQSLDSQITLAPHRAVYDLKLLQSRGKRSLESARGRILYDFSGSACEGYTLQFRQVTDLDSGEGKRVVSDLRATNWEAGDGAQFRFANNNYSDGKSADASEGSARVVGEKVVIELTKPLAKKIDAPALVFPAAHMRRVIAAAKEGKTLVEVPLYDGSETGERVYNTLTVVGSAIAPSASKPSDAAAGQKALENLIRWPMTVSYFESEKAGSDQTPAYSISFETYENGISRALKLDYGDFVLSGEMTSLEIKEPKPCS
jgi:hypothetical protein